MLSSRSILDDRLGESRARKSLHIEAMWDKRYARGKVGGGEGPVRFGAPGGQDSGGRGPEARVGGSLRPLIATYHLLLDIWLIVNIPRQALVNADHDTTSSSIRCGDHIIVPIFQFFDFEMHPAQHQSAVGSRHTSRQDATAVRRSLGE